MRPTTGQAPRAGRGTRSSSTLQRGAAVVQLHHAHRPRWRGVHAQLAEHALVEVLAHDLRAAVAGGEDVHRAGLLELQRQLAVCPGLVGQLDVDEDALAHAATRSRSLTRSGIWEISSATVMPAASRRAIFSLAVSSLPSTIVPAWPKLMPGISSMNRPAMKATIGRRQSFSFSQRASSASMRPPGSV